MIATDDSASNRPFVSWFGGRLDQVDLSKWDGVRKETNPSTPSPITLSQRTLFICEHGTGFCKELWLPFVHLLRQACTDPENAHVLLIDLAGHGDSEEGPVTDMVETFADSIEQAVDEFEASLSFPMDTFSRVVGIGHSMGCTALLTVSGRRSGLFNELIMYEPVLIAKPSPAGIELSKRTVRRRKEFPSREEAFKFWVGRGAFAEWREDILDLYVHEALRFDPDLPGFTLKCEPSYEAEVYGKAMYKGKLDELTPVVTILCGTETYHDTDRLRRLYDMFPNRKEFELLQGLDHFGPMHTPGLYLKYMRPNAKQSRL